MLPQLELIKDIIVFLQSRVVSDLSIIHYVFPWLASLVLYIFLNGGTLKKEEFSFSFVLSGAALSTILFIALGSSHVFVSTMFGIFLGPMLMGKYVVFTKDFIKKKGKTTPKKESSDKLKKNNDSEEMVFKPNYDIMDLLVLYDYISKNQRDKVLVENLFVHPDKTAEKLLTKYALTQEELNEVRAILNLSKMKGYLVSKEEAINYIKELRRKEEEDANRKYI